jgi:hypothetical protein
MDLIFKNTPNDIVIQILEYSGIIKYRHGTFINQFQKNDMRYKMLEKYTQFKPVFLYERSTEPIHYIRDLGKYFVKLQIVTNMDNTLKYRYIFTRKREKNDTSIIILYYHKLL